MILYPIVTSTILANHPCGCAFHSSNIAEIASCLMFGTASSFADRNHPVGMLDTFLTTINFSGWSKYLKFLWCYTRVAMYELIHVKL